jgi:hypothetical protein
MLEQKVRSLKIVDVSVCLDKVVSNTLNVVDDDQLDMLFLDPLGQVYEYLVVVLQRLAMGEDDVFPDLLFWYFILVVEQKAIFYLVESLLVQRLACHQVQALATQASVLRGQKTLKQQLNRKLGLARSRLSIDLV